MSKKFKHKRITFNSEHGPGNRDNFRKYDRPSVIEKPEDEDSSTIAHLQPEILPRSLMMSLLLDRGCGAIIENEESADVIIKLFLKHITPKPQRKYKQNRKGRFLAKLRHKKEKLKFTDSDNWNIMKDVEKKPKSLSSTTILSSSILTPETQSQSKSTISIINPERKKIKLKSTSSTSLDSIHIIKRPKSNDSSSEKETEKNVEKSSKINLKRNSEVENTIKAKVIKLDRSSSSVLNTSKVQSEVENTPKVKVIKLDRSSSSVLNTSKVQSEVENAPKAKVIKLDRSSSSVLNTSKVQSEVPDLPSGKKKKLPISWP